MKSQHEKYYGKKFSKLTIIKLSYFNIEEGFNRAIVLCNCDCGNEKAIRLKDILNGKTQSCGCLLKEKSGARAITHGKTETTEYRIWSNMLTRCYNQKSESYKYYGARGIKVCERWLNSFENFFMDMGNRPSLRLTLDRIDNDGNYEPSNCRWATYSQQRNNQRVSNKTTFIEYNGTTKRLVDWASLLQIKYQTLYSRVVVKRMSGEDAINYGLEEKKQQLKQQYHATLDTN